MRLVADALETSGNLGTWGTPRDTNVQAGSATSAVDSGAKPT
jgi:hypothetical protein